ncbi:hypothetical protein Hypma_001662 [Hypsizygus marmoreus]|uniref:Uncharacterized protein n=1 Tax=Hypsizygus marmoreus TaxID=39966 RepID=A0A369J7C8_HYPMA|nr:hypothetical protein Hypma_001662 [Hypsizygus marmoreus]
MTSLPSDPESLQGTVSRLDSSTTDYYKGLADQFSSLVIMSTFAAGLIIAFLSLARDIITQSESPSPGAITLYEFGMWLGLSVMGLHINVILVGGRACALCSRLHAASPKPLRACALCSPLQAASPKELPPSLAKFSDINFERFVQYCHRVQVLAALLLPTSLHFLSYPMFSNHAFFWVLLAGAFLGVLLMKRIGFFTISLTGEAVEDIKEIVEDTRKTMAVAKDTIAKASLKGLFSSHERASLPGP